MTPREIDALVAEKVMGITWNSKRCRVCGWALKPNFTNGCVTDNCSMWPAPEHRADESALYSTNIAFALKVAETMHDKQPTFELVAQPFVRPRVWICRMYGVEVVADTAPLAICLAALKFVGIEVPSRELPKEITRS